MYSDVSFLCLVHGIWPNTSSESLQVTIGKLEMGINTSPILNLLLMYKAFGEFVLLKLMVKNQANKYSTSYAACVTTSMANAAALYINAWLLRKHSKISNLTFRCLNLSKIKSLESNSPEFKRKSNLALMGSL